MAVEETTMTRCQMRAMKQLRELHEAYDKHDWVLAGSARWYNTTEPVWMCPCGTFMYEDDKGNKAPYTPDTCSEWVLRAHDCLNNARKEVFKAFLKRIGWVADTKRAARIIYGSKGKSRWQLEYGQYESKKDWEKAQEDRHAY